MRAVPSTPDDLTVSGLAETSAGTKDDAETIGPAGRAAIHVAPPQSFRSSARDGRGLGPGEIVAGRYRIVALLGKGGMGEVYRADDLTLDQPVALKFLPADVGNSDRRLELFHNELRTARQVSHKNVCRLYDLGESHGRRFLTMEYVDGEDLASLLKRIGRLPHDKGIEIARQLCAGLAAAHDRGVLHRDLKPANVMLDGEGHVRITDFGLAVAAGDAEAVLAGTPQYMSPEQLRGQPASVQSDIFALGLVLFEIFTGRRAYDARTFDELRAVHESGAMRTPGSVIRDMDPSVERVIMRALDRDPGRRPQSAIAVAAALPGSDPIAAALAAGETPSPEMLAAAGEAEALPVRRGLMMLAAFAIGLAIFFAASPRMSVPGLIALNRPTDVLLDRADKLAVALGYTDAYADRAYGTMLWNDYQAWTQRSHPGDWREIFERTPPSPVLLWYRTSPRPLEPAGAELTLTDPPHTTGGMRTMRFDADGRLIEFRIVPRDRDAETATADGSWDVLFDAASLRRSDFTETTPISVPRMFGDRRAAWTGPYLGRAEMPVRIEAASLHGRPVWFQVFGPWADPAAAGVATASSGIGGMISTILLVSALLVAAILARYNAVADRADWRGARRLAMTIAIGGVAVWIVSPHGSSVDIETRQLIKNLGFAVLWGTGCWVLYLAIEPFARRFWPDGLLGWSRLFAGHVRDSRVGRDVLVGLVASAAFMIINLGIRAVQMANHDGRRFTLFGNEVGSLSHPMTVVSTWAASLLDAMFTALLAALLYMGARAAQTTVAGGGGQRRAPVTRHQQRIDHHRQLDRPRDHYVPIAGDHQPDHAYRPASVRDRRRSRRPAHRRPADAARAGVACDAIESDAADARGTRGLRLPCRTRRAAAVRRVVRTYLAG